MRSVARRYGLTLRTVQRWVKRAGDQALDTVDWKDRPDGPYCPHNRTPREMEDRVLQERARLRRESDLGEHGAEAVHRELVEDPSVEVIPAVRTIGRIFQRRGALDGQRRIRRRPPPPGWYLPDVVQRDVEMDCFDFIEDLFIKGGIGFEVLNGVSVHGGLVSSWPLATATAQTAVECLIERWREDGLPTYAQFDNDTRFQGPRQPVGVLGRVIRLCLGLGVTPVFVVPYEMGFQGAVESLNARWLAKVWTRFHFEDLPSLQSQSAKYVLAHRKRSAARSEAAPPRRSFPEQWRLEYDLEPMGRMVFIRRANDHGAVTLLNQTFTVAPIWAHRLVRCDVLFEEQVIQFHALRRSDPDFRLLLHEVHFAPHQPVFPFQE